MIFKCRLLRCQGEGTSVVAIISLLVILVLSLLVTRVATVALTHTGLSRESARFQARSAFSGVGFTTSEAERVVQHPVRRRILMLLMLLGNAGIVTAVASLMLTFVNTGGPGDWLPRILLLIAGLALLWMLATSRWVDQHLSRVISRALRRWTNLDVRDYAHLFRLVGEYGVTEIQVKSGDWMAGKPLSQLNLPDEGILVLGIQRADGTYTGAPTGRTPVHPDDTLILYGRSSLLAELDTRRAGLAGELAHHEAVAKQRSAAKEQEMEVE